MKRGMFRSLLVESLSLRALMAADGVVAEDFNDGNANDFTSVYSGAQFAGVVDSNSSHGKVFQIDYTKDASQAFDDRLIMSVLSLIQQNRQPRRHRNQWMLFALK